MKVIAEGQTWQLIDEYDRIRAFLEVDRSFQVKRAVVCPILGRYERDYVTVLAHVASHVVQYVVDRPGFSATSKVSLLTSIGYFEAASLPQFKGQSKQALIDGLSRLGVEVALDPIDSVALLLGQVIIDPVLKRNKVMIGEFGKSSSGEQQVTFAAKGSSLFRAWKLSPGAAELVSPADAMPRGNPAYTINSAMGIDAVAQGKAASTLAAPFTGTAPYPDALSSSWSLVQGPCAKGNKVELGLKIDKLFSRGSIEEIRDLLLALFVDKGKFVGWR